MFVEEQKITAAGYSTGTANRAEEAKDTTAAESAAADAEGIVEEEEQKKQAEIVELRLNWSRNFLEQGGFQFVMSQMYSLDVVNGDRR